MEKAGESDELARHKFRDKQAEKLEILGQPGHHEAGQDKPVPKTSLGPAKLQGALEHAQCRGARTHRGIMRFGFANPKPTI